MAACGTCTSTTPFTFSAQYFYNQQCDGCILPGCGGASTDAKCIYYNGPALVCSGIEPLDTLETALQKIDEQICAVTGDYSTYEYNCLEAWCSCTITTEAQFVDQITAYACETTTNLNTFLSTTFPTYQSALNDRFIALEFPGITCVAAGVDSTTPITEILELYCALFGDILDAIDVSSVDWDSCFVVGGPPSTIIEGFNLVISQLCEVKAVADAAAVLPVFNNTGYLCLTGGGTDDTLVSTITQILDILCSFDSFEYAAVNWSCLDDSGATNLQESFQALVDEVLDLSTVSPTFSGDFVVELVDVGDPCLGVLVSLATPINQDRFVASNGADVSPGTLIDKLSAGTNITLDDTTTPGLVIINSTGDSYTVKADSGDAAAGYLIDKVEGQTDVTGAISIAETYNAGTDKVDLTPTINITEFMELIFSTIEGDVTWRSRFCSIASTCVPGLTCTAYTLTNDGLSTTSYSYTDCAGVFHSEDLAASASIDVCALGGVLVTGSISVVDLGPCADTTTTTTTTTTVP